MKIMHIFSQANRFDDVHIDGTLESLQSLLDSISRSLKTGGSTATNHFTADGYEYDIYVALVDDKAADKMPLPYIENE